jgi:putative hemolysin
VLANGVFSGAEIAILSVRKSRLSELVAQGSTRARAVADLRETPERFLATVQVGITVIGSAAAAFGGASIGKELAETFTRLGFGRYAEEAGIGVVVASVSFLSLVLGELVPKSLGLRYSEPYALTIAKPLGVVAQITRPLVWGLTFSSNAFLRLFGDETSFTEARLSREELSLLVKEATTHGTLDRDAGEIASRAFDFSNLTARDVMVPRSQAIFLDLAANDAELRALLGAQRHQRYPVFEGAVDNIVGYIRTSDLFARAIVGEPIGLGEFLRKPCFVAEAMTAVDVLRELQRQKMHLALVVDEVGGVSGLLTIEDLLEELVGDILAEHELGALEERDEHGGLLLRGETPLRDVNRALDLSLPEDLGFNTIAGLCIAESGRIPVTGTEILAHGAHIHVVEASARRVLRVAVRPSLDEPTSARPSAGKVAANK